MGAFSLTSARTPAAAAPGEESPTKPPSRSFLSRFSLPIRSRNRNVADFHISPREPHRKYSAGDHVEGAVVLTILKSVRITHLTVTLHGFVRVYKSPNATGELNINPAEIPSGPENKARYFGNGFARLFQDEQVLSGDGKLEPGKYEFGFDLLFPEKGLPSSIDFERGTISYMITATLTRPTGMAAVQSCDRKIFLLEQVDIGSLPPPRPRTISLEPISKRSKRRKAAPVDRTSVISDGGETIVSDRDSTRAVENSTEGSVAAEDHHSHHDNLATPRSPTHPTHPTHYDIRSEVSGESGGSGSTNRSGRAHGPHQAGSSSSQGGGSRPTVEEKTITASIELQKGGCLPGDIIPIRITVHHIKWIKSMHGVIVTLYRQGRIDSAPSPTLFQGLSKEEMRQLEKDEFYPKSKTGLGGLSLTSAGSCSMFRKDLSQSFTPLLIDPTTLTANVNASVRVPEDVFPTIKGVPGEMINFRYQVEVIVDLGGKLANYLQSKQAKSGGAVSSPAATPGVFPPRNPYEGSGLLPTWNGSIIDTDQLRRQKGVISVMFEVIVGTSDSSRARARALSRTATYTQQVDASHINAQDPNGDWREPHDDELYAPDNREYANYPYPEEYPAFPQITTTLHEASYNEPPAPPLPAPLYIPPPQVPEERELSEKERIRRAEQRLLPSQPGQAPEAGPSSSGGGEPSSRANGPASPSAPTITFLLPTMPRRDSGPLSEAPSAPAPDAPVDSHAPSAPTLDDLTPVPTSVASEDKQELERRRLLAEASAPPEFPQDYDPGVGSSGSSAPHGPSAPPGADAVVTEPSAPVLTEEEDDYGAQYSYRAITGPQPPPPAAGHEPLPKYER